MAGTPTPTDPGTTETTTPAPASDTPAAGETLLGGEATAPAPEPFDPENFTVPDNLDKSHESYKDFVETAKEYGFNKTQAEKLVGLHSAAVKATVDKMWDEVKARNATWLDDIKKDPEIGNTDEVRCAVGTLLDNAALSDPGFRAAIDMTGAGNHPAIVRTLYRWAKALNEGGSVQGDPARRNADGSVAGEQRPSPGAALYGPNGPHTGGPKLG